MTQEGWASIWGHVDELRQTILRSFLIIGLGFVILLGFYPSFLHFLTTNSLERVEGGLTKRRINREEITNQTSQQSLFELPPHARIVFDQKIPEIQQGQHLYYRLDPGQSLLYEQTINSPLLILGPMEGITLVFKMCFWLSIALTAPLWGWVWLQFILPGLKSREKVLILPFMICSLFSLGIGITFAYFVTLPLANQYLSVFNLSIGQNAWTVTHYVNYVLFLCLGHAVAAELGFILFLLVHYRFLSPTWLISKRRYMIVLAFVLGAFLTPQDVISQLLLALPLVILYEIAIWYSKFRVT